MPKQYWVIGGEYSDADFQQVEEGTSRVFGPYNSYGDAHEVWRRRSEMSRARAFTRYMIVANAANPARQMRELEFA